MKKLEPLDAGWAELAGAASEVAPRLLGAELVRKLNGQALRGRIVEVEAYDQADAASHSYRGNTPRTSVMFGPPGFVYVYFTYGMHYCMNVVVGPPGHGAATLIRAIEPLEGEAIMSANRHGISGVNISNGPAKLCQALKIDKSFNGHNLQGATLLQGGTLQSNPLRLLLRPRLPQEQIVQTTRIGISRATNKPWRFYIKGNPYVSRTAVA